VGCAAGYDGRNETSPTEVGCVSDRLVGSFEVVEVNILFIGHGHASQNLWLFSVPAFVFIVSVMAFYKGVALSNADEFITI